MVCKRHDWQFLLPLLVCIIESPTRNVVCASALSLFYLPCETCTHQCKGHEIAVESVSCLANFFTCVMHCNTKAVQHFRVKVMYVVMRLCVPSHSEAYTCVKWALLKGHTQSMAIETMQLYHLDAAVSLLHGSFKHLSSGSGKNCVALQTYCFLSIPIKFFFFLFVSTSTL